MKYTHRFLDGSYLVFFYNLIFYVFGTKVQIVVPDQVWSFDFPGSDIDGVILNTSRLIAKVQWPNNRPRIIDIIFLKI